MAGENKVIAAGDKKLESAIATKLKQVDSDDRKYLMRDKTILFVFAYFDAVTGRENFVKAILC